jgi:hypothetical protein
MENAERRLELIKMMRDEHKDNLGRIQRRERILYPNRKLSYSDLMDNRSRADYNKSGRYDSNLDIHTSTDQVNTKPNYGFYMRLGISIGLFLLFYYMDNNNISYFGITCDMVQNMISDTFDLKSFAFMQ